MNFLFEENKLRTRKLLSVKKGSLLNLSES